MAPTVDHRIAALATPQRGLFTRRQAFAIGITSDELRRRVARGSLVRLGGGAVLIAGHELTWDRRLLASLLAAGTEAVVSHRAAAHLLGFDGFDEGPCDITVPRGRLPAVPSWTTLHTSSRLERIDRVASPPFRLTSGARTIIQLAVSAGGDELTAAIGSAIRDGWTSERFLRRRLAALRGPGRHGVRRLDMVLDGPAVESELERRFLRLVRRAGFPTPTTQRVFHGTRTMRVDACWERERVVAEVMGHRFHCTAADLQRDAQRRNELQTLGFAVLEFTAIAITRDEPGVVATLGHYLERPLA